ncbi:MAG: UDP-N-acetylglucosamine 2-epimerase (non-hydrolyzing) [Parvibaculum sp.]
MIVVGTRPEMIKLAPLILEIKRTAIDKFDPVVVFTGQHEELVQQASEVFGISPDIQLHEMHADDNLTKLTSRLLVDMGEVLTQAQPDVLIVQGDTTSAFAAGLAAFYQRIPVAHVEAGLRTKDIYSPFPEEANRIILTRLAAINFAPTPTACDNLISEGVPRSQIVVTGNTVIDAIDLARSWAGSRNVEKGAAVLQDGTTYSGHDASS